MGKKRWTLRLLAERMVALDAVPDLSHETMRQVLGEECPQAAPAADVVHSAQAIGRVRHVEPRGSPDIADKLEIRHAPKHGSWLNMAEIELGVFRRDLPERVVGKATLERHAAAWQRRRNTAAAKADWRCPVPTWVETALPFLGWFRSQA